MLRTFIYHDDNWIEETENLLLHDCVAFLDEEERRIYLYNGPKSTYKRLEKGYDSVTKLMLNLPDDSIQLTVLLDEIPEKIQTKIDTMFKKVRKEEEAHKRIFSSLISIRLYLVFSIITLILTFISMVNLANLLFQPVTSGVIEVTAVNYNLWFYISRILTIFATTFFIFNIIIGSYEQDVQVVIFSVIGAIVSIGLIIYYGQGIYLFKFQPGWDSTRYLILQLDLVAFFALILFATLIIEIPSFLKLISFVRTYRKYIFLR